MKSKKPLYPYIVWMIAFTVIPIGLVAYYAFAGISDPSEALTPVIKNRTVYFDSFWIALLSTAICFVIAYPLALIMSRMSVRGQRMMNILVMLPMWMNFILRIVSLEVILMPEGVLNHLFGWESNPIWYTWIAVVVGIVYDYLPFMILPLYTVLSKISPSILEAGRDLGCSAWQLLWKVIFPLSIPGVISGITMVFVPAASSFVIASRLGGFNLIGDQIAHFYQNDHNLTATSILSFALMIVIVISMAVMNHFDKDDDIVLV